MLKRGRLEIVVNGEEAAEIVRDLLHYVSEGGFTPEDLVERFLPNERETVGELIKHLISKRILVPEDDTPESTDGEETQLDIFYWHFGERGSNVAEVLNSQRFLIVGVNKISQQLIAALAALRVSSFQVVDYPLLRNLCLFDERGERVGAGWPGNSVLMRKGSPNEIDPESFDILIATSDFGGFGLLREWNEFCVLHDRCFLPVVLQDLVGYVGPVVLPRKTACFECFILRQNAHMSNPLIERAAEFTAFEGQTAVGFHPSMASILGDIAAFELTKFYGLGPATWTIGTQIEVNLLAATMNGRKVLRLPRCPVCTSLHERTSITPFKNISPQSSGNGDNA
jgi:bacteriocin biosynthesis cyclodehydratase domain-containing protein